MSKLNVVGISGSPSRPSRTTALVSAVLDAIRDHEAVTAQLIDLTDSAPTIFAASSYDRLSPEGREMIDDIEKADLLVVGTPVYRGSYTASVRPRPVRPSTGNARDPYRHRRQPNARPGDRASAAPAVRFLRALSLPTTVYATETDFENYVLVSNPVRQRVAAGDAIRVLVLREPMLRSKAAPPPLAIPA